MKTAGSKQGEMRNFFTGGGIPMSLTRLSYDTTVSVGPDQLPYYAYKVFRDPSWTPAGDDGTPLLIEGCARLDARDKSDPMRMEREFLDTLGLLIRGPNDALFVSPLTAMLYRGGPTALFGMDLNVRLSSMEAPERAEFLRPIMRLLSDYTLPGRLFWLQGAQGTLSPNIYLTTRSVRELVEMQAMIQTIRGGL